MNAPVKRSGSNRREVQDVLAVPTPLHQQRRLAAHEIQVALHLVLRGFVLRLEHVWNTQRFNTGTPSHGVNRNGGRRFGRRGVTC